MSNQNQNLILFDAFGTIIDSVHYLSTSPWPNANGNGYYLSLLENNSDNGIASSWQAVVDDGIAQTKEILKNESTISIYPNPVVDKLYINSKEPIKEINIYDCTGKLIHNVRNSNTIDVSNIVPGVYLIKCSTAKFSVIKKIVK